ncbi:hypothetical protein D3C80_1074440 [compost metagenome]
MRVAVASKEHAAQGAGDEPDREGAEGGDLRHERRQVGREEQMRKDQRGGGAVDEEVVPFDRGAGRSHDRDLYARPLPGILRH